jgi:hypothetical protein
MSIKTKAPSIKEDPTTARLRQQAEARAESDRREAGQGYADSQTRKILRRFGMVANRAGAGGMAGFNPFQVLNTFLGGSGSGSSGGGLTSPFVRQSSGGLSLQPRQEN